MTKKYILKIILVILATIITVPTIVFILSFVKRGDILLMVVMTILIAQTYMRIIDPSDIYRRNPDRELFKRIEYIEVEVESIKEILHREGFIDLDEVSLKTKIAHTIRVKEEEEKEEEL